MILERKRQVCIIVGLSLQDNIANTILFPGIAVV